LLYYLLNDSIALLILKVRFQVGVFPKKGLDNIGNNSIQLSLDEEIDDD